MAWCQFFREEDNTPTTDQLYLAQIACEVRRVLAKDPNKITIKDFIFKFAPDKDEPLTEAQKQEHMQASKNAWAAMLAGTKT